MLLQVYLLVLVLYEVKSGDLTGTTYRDLDENIISVNNYCEKKNCLVKCCPKGQFLAPTKQEGIRCVSPKKPEVLSLLNYENVSVYKWNTSNDLEKTTKNIQTAFDFIRNDVLSDANKTVTLFWCDIYVLEDGSLRAKSPCTDTERLEFCVDFFIAGKKNTSRGVEPDIVWAYRGVIQNDGDAKSKHDFVAAGMLISAFFMLLVLIVYGLLPRLQNIVGMVLMAYLLTLIVAYILKAAQLIALTTFTIDDIGCSRFSPAVYYFILASFFWLNIMSFDLWWTIRGTRKSRDIHRQGERMKFMWYGLYAWGVPAVFTLIIVAVDRLKLYNDVHYKPPFESCFVDKTPTAVYMHVPIAIMTATNCILFLLTAYNIWLVKRAVYNTKDSRNTKNSENRFAVYIKLSVLMGVSWVLELVPDLPLIPHIILNFYNVFIGVAIFIIFVCKSSIIVMLCKRFKITNSFVERMQTSQYTKSETTKSSSTRKRSTNGPNKEDEATELTTYATEAA